MPFDGRFTLTRWRLLLGVVVDDVYQKWRLFVDMGQLEMAACRVAMPTLERHIGISSLSCESGRQPHSISRSLLLNIFLAANNITFQGASNGNLHILPRMKPGFQVTCSHQCPRSYICLTLLTYTYTLSLAELDELLSIS